MTCIVLTLVSHFCEAASHTCCTELLLHAFVDVALLTRKQRHPCTIDAHSLVSALQIASRISPQMKFGPPSRPFLQVPVISLAQKIVVSEPGYEPKFQGRPEQGSDLYKAMLEDTGEAVAMQLALILNNKYQQPCYW